MSATVPVVPASSPNAPTSNRARAVIEASVFGTPGRNLAAAGVLSALAGFVDAAGFIGLFGLFAAHVTGDLVAAGTTLAGGIHEGLTLRLVAILVFMIAVATAALVARAARRRRRRPLTALFALMTFALALFCTTGVLLRPQLQGPDAWAVVLTGAVGVFGMGVQNALMRDVLCSLGATTLMTGNLTQLTMDLVEVVLPDKTNGPSTERSRQRLEMRRRLAKSGTSVSAFLLGTVLGGAAIMRYGFWSIALPATVAGILTFATWLPSRVRHEQPARDPRLLPAPSRRPPHRVSGIQEIDPHSRPWAARPGTEIAAAVRTDDSNGRAQGLRWPSGAP
jgi:uncharacterized membrane protein YoaK (UPF0700 family)